VQKIGLPAIIPAQLPAEIPDWRQAVLELNERHAVIESIAGKTVIASWEPSQLHPGFLQIVYQNKESFTLRYSNRRVQVELTDENGESNVEKMVLGKFWLSSRARSQYRGVVFLPAGKPIVNGCLNIWQRWGVEPRRGDWSLIRWHIENVIANGNKEWADYYIRWDAWAIQNPDKRAEVAKVLIGQKGSGKGTMAELLERIFRPHTRRAVDQEGIVGKFNAHLKSYSLPTKHFGLGTRKRLVAFNQ
jgi:hypothetical protein